MPFCSVVIPVYKSSNSLSIIAQHIFQIGKSEDIDFEIIFVNDSPFYLETVKQLQKIEMEYSFIKVFNLRKNQGQHIATLVGLSRAGGEYVVTMDDDLQHPVSELPRMIKFLYEQQLEGVFALSNYRERKHNLWRSAGSYFLKKIDAVFLNKPKGLVLSSFRIMTKDLARATVAGYTAMPSVSSLMVNATDNLRNLKVEHKSREFGKTNYTLNKLFNLALNSIIYYSSLPLRIIGILGIFGFIGSMIFIIIVISRKFLSGIEFPGYASTVTLISIFGGLNLFAMGIIGEYLIRVIKEQQKPALDDLIK